MRILKTLGVYLLLGIIVSVGSDWLSAIALVVAIAATVQIWRKPKEAPTPKA